MPFIGRDWRSPGEAWVKTESLGWQRMKIIESQLHLTCHQNHTAACSWPPRSQFGHHMELNFSKQQQAGIRDKSVKEATPNQILCGDSSGNDIYSSESGSSSSSASTSPTTTPEKNNSVHHIHAITISSPYGRYAASSCCAHPYHHNTNNNDNIDHHATDCHQYQYSLCSPKDMTSTQISRSLSREAISPVTNCSGCTAPTMRHSKSVSCFRNSNDYNVDHHEVGANRAPTDDKNDMVPLNQEVIPAIMENGIRIDDRVFGSPFVDKQSYDQPGQGMYGSFITPSPPTLATLNQCECCCCSELHCSQSHQHLIKEMQQPKIAPHCRISVRTREVAMHNTISEAFYRLDFYNAIHDIRRFNYICKLLHLLITQNLTSLSGCATRVLFTMLEQVAWEVSTNKRNIHVIRDLLNELKLTIQKYYCWGRPIGSSLLWQQHFETIERISQIVGGIDLSPPKNESYKVTFNKLPVEMIREILVRLSDYRDLINSAQASPVMRTMIDSQSIWQKLCRYHFTEQQLKVALDSNLVKRNLLRGVKYARFTSADGRISYRNPVTLKPSSSSSVAATGAATSTSSGQSGTRQQLEQTNNQRDGATTSNRRNSSSSSSYVSNTVKIFDDRQQRSSVRPSRSSKNCDTNRGNTANVSESTKSSATATRTTERVKAGQDSSGQSIIVDRSNTEIDWERVFHQLRKRFDLKEEYADCLLLCRHCRCLFWKSIGHPCIRSEDMHQQPSQRDLLTERYSTRDSLSDGRRSTRHNDQSGSQDKSALSSDRGGKRPSVASLSRNFDSSSRQLDYDGDENLPQPATTEAARQQRVFRSTAVTGHRRRPFENLGAQLREHNSGRQQFQANPSVARDNAAAPSSTRREELVPKHVTITPQAFLKFFSL